MWNLALCLPRRPRGSDRRRFAAVGHRAMPALALQRGLVRSAVGYLCNQAAALRQYLTDGRLPMTNNESERELRRIAMGRKAWLFVGSDDHAQAAGNLLSLIATARRDVWILFALRSVGSITGDEKRELRVVHELEKGLANWDDLLKKRNPNGF